ncbi:hypothetical protein J6590_028036 [Homalodisca vitripennis]|nr:hypothetical protein J6590_028036 [Homalodisca vitripennis]
MKTSCLQYLGIFLLVPLSKSATNGRDGIAVNPFLYNHTDLEFVQCNHSFYKIKPYNGRAEIESSQESRVNPSRQYLPLPDPSRQYLPQPDVPNLLKSEEDPAASFDQPNFLSVENTFLSPSLQKNYKSLFNQNEKTDTLSPAAANVPSNALPLPSPRKTNNKKHSDEDDEDNLERLCNDAFHSFLCKPIKGPRKTPNGRLRQNAVLPPDILAGFSSNQDIARVRPNNKEPPQSAFNNIGYSFAKPTTTTVPSSPQPNPANQFPQRLPFPKPISTTTKIHSTTPTPFVNILKTIDPSNPILPSPTNTDLHVIKPQTSIDASLKASAQTNGYFYEKPIAPFPPQISNPSDKNIQITQNPAYPTFKPGTQKPNTTPGYVYDKPRIPFPSNNIPQVVQSPQPKSIPQHDCSNHKSPINPIIANPSNENPYILKPSTPKPFIRTTKPVFTFPTTNVPKYNPVTFKNPSKPFQSHDCDKPKPFPFPASNPTNQNPAVPKPFNQQSSKAINKPDTPKVPSPSNNIAQILAQPQQVKAVTVPPQRSSGYYYEKPAKPFPDPVGNPGFQNPVVIQRPTEPPFNSKPTTITPGNGYFYDQPRIPFSSNNIAQIISKPSQPRTFAQVKPFRTTTPAPNVPCEHENQKLNSFPSSITSKPTNQNNIIVKSDSTSNAYVYDKPNVPFPPQVSGPSIQNSVSLRPFTTTTSVPFRPTGYTYDRPEKSFSLPNPTNNVPSFISSPANNGYNYQKPQNPFSSQRTLTADRFGYSTTSGASISPSPTASTGYSYEQPRIPFSSNITPKVVSKNEPNLIGNPQTQVEVTIRPGYAYNKPYNPFVSPQPTNGGFDVEGYSYPKPSIPFIR